MSNCFEFVHGARNILLAAGVDLASPQGAAALALAEDDQRALEDWFCRVGGGGKRFFDIVVGNEAMGHTAADVDILCTGTDDDQTIQAYLDALVAPRYDNIGLLFLGGDYYFTGLLAAGGDVRGMGVSKDADNVATVIHAEPASLTGAAIIYTTLGTVSDLSIRAENGNVGCAVTAVRVERVFVSGVVDDAGFAAIEAYEAVIACEVNGGGDSNAARGIRPILDTCRIIGNKVIGAKVGIYSDQEATVIEGNVVEQSFSHGIETVAIFGGQCPINGNVSRNNGGDGILSAGPSNAVVGNVAVGNAGAQVTVTGAGSTNTGNVVA